MIEILDIKDKEPKKLDITPELMAAAYNVIRQGCKNQCKCDRCALYGNYTGCAVDDNGAPVDWPDLDWPDLEASNDNNQ